MSNIICENLYQINIKDYGKEFIDRIARHFGQEEIVKTFPKRCKCFVALDNNEVVGTASIDKLQGDETGTKYIILTVFVKIAQQHQGIDRLLIEEIEKCAKEIGAKELIVPASIYGCEFYGKLGYHYMNGKKELNEEKQYMMIKSI